MLLGRGVRRSCWFLLKEKDSQVSNYTHAHTLTHSHKLLLISSPALGMLMADEAQTQLHRVLVSEWLTWHWLEAQKLNLIHFLKRSNNYTFLQISSLFFIYATFQPWLTAECSGLGLISSTPDYQSENLPNLEKHCKRQRRTGRIQLLLLRSAYLQTARV